MASDLEQQVKQDIVDQVEKIYNETVPPDVLIRPLKPELELEKENAPMSNMEKSARFKVLNSEHLATIKAQMVADVVDITEQTLAEAEAIVKELVTDPAQQHQILSYIEKGLAKEGVWAQFDKPELEVKASTEVETKATGSLRDRIKGLL
jgi:hypothetical protein